uniref:TLDc domain-containing protein n=1 Tax=Rhizophagus irregularis (strain DAOM 181602 / DAOM 197198 / MUCL 43194) TaxID=747089 RepID=U9UMP4_RHIID
MGLSPKDFLCKIYPYKKLLDQQLFESLLSSYMNPDSEPSDNNILLPRNIKIDEIIDTKIVNLNIISIIFRWINNVDYNSKYSYLRELYLPYKFKLILRGSRDGFTPTKFHELCDNKSNTITFIKVKGTDEILGGYNPLTWTPSGSYHQTMHSFIFSFKSKCNLKNAILSNVKDIDHTINNRVLNHGIFFGDDLMTWGSNIYNDYDHLYSKKLYYEKKIRDDDKFTIEDYEVFQIITKN